MDTKHIKEGDVKGFPYPQCRVFYTDTGYPGMNPENLGQDHVGCNVAPQSTLL